MRKRHEEEEEHASSERWLLTYADMITLLMAFFILLYTMSRVDAAKMKGIISSVKQNLGYSFVSLISPIQNSPFDTYPITTNAIPPIVGTAQVIPAAYKLTAKRISKSLERDGFGDKVKVMKDRRGMVISLISGVLFDLQSAKLKPSAKSLLDAVGTILAEIPNNLVVEGHSDEQDFPNKHGLSPNWHLSSSRALAVLEYLATNKFVTENRLSIAAFADNRPIASKTLPDDERFRLNRRVDIVLVGESPFESNKELHLPLDKNDRDLGW